MTRLLVVPSALVALSLLAAGCGGSSKTPSVANVGTTTVAAATSTTSSGSGSIRQQELAYSRCMRSHGVPRFPDPSPGGGFEFSAGSGVDPSSPAVRAAQAKCHKDLPSGGGIAPGAQTHPTAQWLAHMTSVARCMRRHGVTDFPDPRTSIPSPLPVNGMVSDIQGAVLVFTNSAELQTPLFVRAAGACGYPLHNH